VSDSPRFDPHLAYRPEIDGMRAIAVLAVVLYHFSIPGLGGGMVGVDIFFVISGFLIGGILWRELKHTNRLRLGAFYIRRIRRLAPAYFAMAALTLLAGYAILLPFEFREFGKELIAATSYLANVHFWRETGYFDIGVENKPLLHTWSLSVEEQFYLFLPFFLLILRFSRRGLVGALWVLFALSLAACIATTPLSHSAAFYLFPFRAWELLAGVLLAIWAEDREVRPRAWASWLGLALMLGGIAFNQPGPGFPGWQVAVPVLGAVLVILNGRERNPVNLLLSTRPLVFTGWISYSLYLWHWPVLTLSLYWRSEYSGWGETVGWLALAVGLSVLSWALVERPLRMAKSIRPGWLLTLWAALSALFIGIGGVIYLKDGAPGRFAPHIRTHIDASADFLQDWTRCHVPETGIWAGTEICPLGPEGKAELLIWGDSHVRAVKEGLEQLAFELDTPALLIWRAGCPPIFGLGKAENTTSRQEDFACAEANARIRVAVGGETGLKRLLLVGRWSYYAEGAGTGSDADNTIQLEALADAGLTSTTQAGLYAESFPRTVALLSQWFEQIYVLRQPPEIPFYGSREIARAAAHGRLPEDAGSLFTVSRETLAARNVRAETPLMAMAARGEIALLDSWPWYCTEHACSALPDGQALYFDNNHITNSAARRMRELFAPAFNGATP
jgi:peptidoglycan/LPS O-acetylase OafA/YrhL